MTLAFGDISLAEIESFFRDRHIRHSLGEVVGRCAIIEAELLPKDTAKILGGIHKIGEVLVRLEVNQNIHSMNSNLDSFSFPQHIAEKSKWAVSVYSNSDESANIMELYLREYFIERLKREKVPKTKILKSDFSDVRGELEVSSNDILEEDLLEDGFEVLAARSSSWLVARTLSVIDHRSFKERDFGRPVQDPLISMPPKLARLLVNLAGCSPGKVLLDPFCGVGTILAEGLATGGVIIGFDIESSRVAATRRNLDWLISKYNLHIKEISSRVRVGNAEKLSMYLPKESIDCIATEPILTPTLKYFPDIDKAETILESAEEVYNTCLAEMEVVMRRKGRLAIVVPCLRTIKGKILSFDLIESAENAGFKALSLVRGKEYPLLLEDRHQKVMRGFYVFEKL